MGAFYMQSPGKVTKHLHVLLHASVLQCKGDCDRTDKWKKLNDTVHCPTWLCAWFLSVPRLQVLMLTQKSNSLNSQQTATTLSKTASSKTTQTAFARFGFSTAMSTIGTVKQLYYFYGTTFVRDTFFFPQSKRI